MIFKINILVIEKAGEDKPYIASSAYELLGQFQMGLISTSEYLKKVIELLEPYEHEADGNWQGVFTTCVIQEPIKVID